MKTKIFLFISFLLVSVFSLGQTLDLQMNTEVYSSLFSFATNTVQGIGQSAVEDKPTLWVNHIIPGFMAVMGLGMAGIWTMDIAKGKFSGNFFQWEENDQLLWPHITTEYLTAASLITSGIGLYTQKEWGMSVSLASLGALSYASLNSMAWALKEKERLGYAVPMMIGLAGAAISFTILID